MVVREPPTYASGKKRRESLSGADKKWSVIHYDKGRSTLSLTKLNDFYYKPVMVDMISHIETHFQWMEWKMQQVLHLN